MLSLILSFVIVSLSCISIAEAEPNTIVVPDDYPNIQEAIDNAERGDTIFVKKGIYYENLDVTESLSLVGEDKDTTIIDGRKIAAVVNITEDIHIWRLITAYC